MPNETDLLDLLLKNRGISVVDRDRFLNPNYEAHMYDPYLLKDMEKACQRIFEALEKNEKIVIYSDYDCDGIPAAVIMHDFFTKLGYQHFSIYIPHRHDEGYGLHADAIKEFIAQKVQLLITFDLGITAVDEVTLATDGGIDVIVTDHHLPHEKVPQAYAIINPKQEGCAYPDKMLCGAGLAFKLVQGLIKKYGKELEEKYPNAQTKPELTRGWEKWLLDMAGLATLADQVPLLDENRVFACYGLRVLKYARRPGLAELFRKAGVNLSTLTEEDVTFTLAPRLNAASRMGTPRHAFEVLSTIDVVAAKTVADHLAKINDERKQIVATIMKEVKKNLTKRLEDEAQKPVIVIGNPNWRVGILGLVAAKISEEYKRPSFVWGSEGSDIIRGSARGWGDVDLVEVMTALPPQSLLAFGGHKGAGGFSVSHEEVHFLEERLLNVFKQLQKNSRDEVVQEEQSIEATITLDDVTAGNYAIIEKLAPYGMNNPKPVFRFENIQIVTMKEFGKEKNHLELVFRDTRRRPIKAIAFFKTHESFGVPLAEGNTIQLLATFEKSTFGGRTELRLRIVDIG